MLEALLSGSRAGSKYYKKLATGPVGRARATLSVVGSLLYLIGGQIDPAGTTNDVNELWIYNPSTDTWAQKTVPGTVPGRRAHATVVIGTKIYVIAGYNNNTGTMADVWVYDTTADTWTSLAAIPTGMSTHCGWAATYNSELCVFVRGPDGVLWRYIPSTNVWASLNTTFAKLGNASGVAFSEVMHLYGGQVTGSAVNGGLRKETATTPAEAILAPATAVTPGARIYHATAASSTRLYLRGGNSDGTAANNDCWEYTVSSNTWRQLDSGGPTQRLHCMVYLNGKLYTYSGTTSPTSLRMSDFWSIDVDSQIPTPGSTTLVAGDAANGNYGPVASSDFFSGSELAAAVGATAYGTLINDTTDWLKLSKDGKTIFIPKKAIRTGLTWNRINALGIRTAAQNKLITKNGKTYRVRLMTATGATWSSNTTGDDPAGCSDSEYNRFIYRLTTAAAASKTAPVLGSYSLSDLGMTVNDNGCCFICQEGTSSAYVQRNGGSGETYNGTSWNSLQTGVNSDLGDQYRGWRPVLELVE